MNHYIYKGVVMAYGKCIANNWMAETYATTEDKARSNLTYQYKMAYKLSANAAVQIPGKLVIV